jgi:CRP-like cAMP-binding protein
VFDGGARTTDMTAIEPTRVSALPAEAFFRALALHPEIARNALKMLCRRVRDPSARLEPIALYPIEQRLARLLLLSLEGAEATPGRRVAVDLNLPQTEIAQLLGATRSKVKVALGKLEEAGVLRRASDRLFCDRDKLMRMAEGAHAREA